MSHRGRYVSGAIYLGGVMTGIQEKSPGNEVESICLATPLQACHSN